MNKEINEIIKRLKTQNKDLILEELDKTNLKPVEKIYVLKEALVISSSEAQSMFLERYKNKVSDELLNMFLGFDEEE